MIGLSERVNTEAHTHTHTNIHTHRGPVYGIMGEKQSEFSALFIQTGGGALSMSWFSSDELPPAPAPVYVDIVD